MIFDFEFAGVSMKYDSDLGIFERKYSNCWKQLNGLNYFVMIKKQKLVLVDKAFELCFGEIPDGYYVEVIDGNRDNLTKDNLVAVLVSKREVTRELILSHYYYDREAGTLTRKYQSDVEYSFHEYLSIYLPLCKVVMTHRAIFFIETGLWPEVVDHIDENKRNNKHTNLRESDFSHNMQMWHDNRKRNAPERIARLAGGAISKIYSKMIIY